LSGCATGVFSRRAQLHEVSLPNDALCSWEFVAPNRSTTDECRFAYRLEASLPDPVGVTTRNLLGETEENHDTPQSRRPVWARFENFPNTSPNCRCHSNVWGYRDLNPGPPK
jgi:hypothetical protein